MTDETEPPAENLPNCGLYRTGRELAGTAEVAAGRLVYFHNHSAQGTPMVQLPASNRHNRWHFHSAGVPVTDGVFIARLETLRREGYYRLREHFHPDERRVVAAQSLVQLGYNANAEPILFFPRLSETDNALVFPERGIKIPPRVYALLEPLDVAGPRQSAPVH